MKRILGFILLALFIFGFSYFLSWGHGISLFYGFLILIAIPVLYILIFAILSLINYLITDDY